MNETKLLSTKNVAVIGLLGAMSAVLMLFEIPIPFIAPSFYGLDFSEVPVLVGTFALGPVGGAVIEVVKILVKLLLKPTSTGFVGEFSNLVIGCTLILPAGLVYKYSRSKKGAVIGMVLGTVMMTVVGVVVNALVMLPFYSNFMPLENIIAAGAVINPAVNNIWTFALICVAPFNLIKGAVASGITAVIYKRISFLIHGMGNRREVRTGKIM